ncbi:hypothetical protein KFK09_026618 [Dendrobium nobile]|uniref:Aromatic amino acid beta-eliminating lyase/threonine aldolase domain-containing protein n=1 Tax=Dendrobium nobile TaxID=94219 RepID=A0A8T3A7B5_DENNO|nr:hypothetical protein KFK09_026618 [Dendrobium nobile]
MFCFPVVRGFYYIYKGEERIPKFFVHCSRRGGLRRILRFSAILTEELKLKQEIRKCRLSSPIQRHFAAKTVVLVRAFLPNLFGREKKNGADEQCHANIGVALFIRDQMASKMAIRWSKQERQTLVCRSFDMAGSESSVHRLVCLSKGLGAPTGSVLVGSKNFIAKARRLRKALGGCMRQLGVLCAAAYVALSENVSKVEEDHRKAKIIADTSVLSPKRLCQVLEERGVLVLPSNSTRQSCRNSFASCCKRGLDDTVILLLSHGANPLVMNDDCQTPLDLARAKGNSNVVRAIQLCINIQTVANMKISYFFTVGNHVGTPLHHDAKKGLDGTIILLLSHGANPFVMNDDCQIPLDLARAKGHSNVVRSIELREIHGLSILEAFASQWVSKKIWAVAVPCDSRNPTNPRKLKPAIYPNLQVCLSKGLGAPTGSVLVGSKNFIAKARRLRKALGGCMRQLGVLCAAAYVALSENVSKVEEDHRKAKIIADTSVLSPKRLCQVLEERGVLVLPSNSTRYRSKLLIPVLLLRSRFHYVFACVVVLVEYFKVLISQISSKDNHVRLYRKKRQSCWNSFASCCKRGLDDTVILLLSHGANPLVMNDDCQTPLDLARAKGNSNVVRAIQNRICLFVGWLREIHWPSIFEAFSPQYVSKKIWVVAVPCDSHNPTNPRKLKLAIYPNLQYTLRLREKPLDSQDFAALGERFVTDLLHQRRSREFSALADSCHPSELVAGAELAAVCRRWTTLPPTRQSSAAAAAPTPPLLSPTSIDSKDRTRRLRPSRHCRRRRRPTPAPIPSVREPAAVRDSDLCPSLIGNLLSPDPSLPLSVY